MELKENKKTGVITKSWKAPARSVGGLLRQACALMKPEEQLSLGTLTEEQVFPLMDEAQWYESMENKTAAAAESTTPATLGAGIPRRKRVNPSALAKAARLHTIIRLPLFHSLAAASARLRGIFMA